MRYNHKKQPFTIMGRFHVQENGETVEYCRVRFNNTKKTQVVSNKLVAEGKFEDASIQSVEKIVKELTELSPFDEPSSIIDMINSGEPSDLSPKEINLDGVNIFEKSVETEFTEDLNPTEIDLLTIEDLAKLEVKPVTIIATNPEGDDLEIDSSSLSQFCEVNNLDEEAVQACLSGDQKTHKKWKFRTV